MKKNLFLLATIKLVFFSYLFLNESYGATEVSEEIIIQARRDIFKTVLKHLATELECDIESNQKIFICYDASFYEMENVQFIGQFCEDLIIAGFEPSNIFFDQWVSRPGSLSDIFIHTDKILHADKVILIGSPQLKSKYEERESNREAAGIISQQINALRTRILKKGNAGIIPVLMSGNIKESSLPGAYTGSK